MVSKSTSDRIAKKSPSRKLINTPLQVVIEVVDGCSPKFRSELERMLSSQPREIVEDLVAAARAAAGNAETDCTQILDVRKVELRQTQLARTEVQAVGARVPVCVQRTE